MSREFYERWDSFHEWSIGKIKQIKSEALLCYLAARDLQPRVFVEIGCAFGGTLYLYGGACAPGATIIGVDTCQFGKLLRQSANRLEAEGKTVHLVKGMSQKPRVIERVKELLWDKQIEFLHLDGAHSAAGVTADWTSYGSLLAPGGLAAFHDIYYRGRGASVHKVWPAIRTQGKTWCALSGSPNSQADHLVGVGLVWK